jgi:hypothetical protein
VTMVIYCPDCGGVCGTGATDPAACRCDSCPTCAELTGAEPSQPSEAFPQAAPDQPASASASPGVGTPAQPIPGLPSTLTTARVLRDLAEHAPDWLRSKMPDGFEMPYSVLQLREHLLAGATACEALQGSRDQRVDLERQVETLREFMRNAIALLDQEADR